MRSEIFKGNLLNRTKDLFYVNKSNDDGEESTSQITVFDNFDTVINDLCLNMEEIDSFPFSSKKDLVDFECFLMSSFSDCEEHKELRKVFRSLTKQRSKDSSGKREERGIGEKDLQEAFLLFGGKKKTEKECREMISQLTNGKSIINKNDFLTLMRQNVQIKLSDDEQITNGENH